MKKAIWLIAIVGLLTATSACKKDLYDIDITKKVLEITFHNDTVDKNHTWRLMNDYIVKVTANVTDVSRIEVLSANPYAPGDHGIDLLAQEEVDEDDEISLAYSAPNINDSVYVAAVTYDGNYHVVAIEKGARTANFTTLNTLNQGTVTSPATQEVYYCYCNSFPQPSSTWSFNDLVFRISKEVISNYVLRINVTLVALGNTNQMAGAVRLDGVKFDEVDNVKISNNKTFCKYTEETRNIIKDDDILLKGQDGSAVINLFDDAHKAFFVRKQDNGVINRYYINVTHTTDINHMEFSPVTVSYDVTFKDGDIARNFGFGQLDPFILYNYNRNIWEVHKYTYKFNEILYSYYSGSPESYDTGYTWALEIPYTWFRYPLQGSSMGSYKNGVIYGTYQKPYHSFGEWGANRNNATDWYFYPSLTVY